MRVAMYYRNSDVRVEQFPVPAIGDDELLLKVMSSGICGSDVMEWYRVKSAPKVLGHEVAGIVEQVGRNVSRFAAGQRVFVTHHVPCNTCRYCLAGKHTACETLHSTNFFPGGFAEYVRVPAINVDRGTFILPQEMSFDEGVFIEPLGCTLRGQRAAGIMPGESVLVMGSGLAGLLHIALAKSLGARVIASDINDYRLQAAKRYGADAVIDARGDVPALLRSHNEGRLADHVVLCTGALPAVEQSFRSVERGGTILIFAVPKPEDHVELPLNAFWRNQVRVVCSYAAAPRDLAEAIGLLRSGRISVREMITHRLPLEKAQEGFLLTAEPKESLKVVLAPHG
ncbi:alcohol dehydrogenase catalytic domain-containing protein [Candidatus Woesearchaeota archaeon]|nr:alcohol dehydrogenase catalytic domain-containing protein [Candidatus Woesearchaeota archaeon]